MSEWISQPVRPLAMAAYQYALERQSRLTKPRGSLGRLEDMAARLCAMQNTDRPAVERVRVAIFAADHGVAEEGVSAFPQVVTREMVRNFAQGGAAISVLAHALDAQLEVVDVGVAYDPGELPGVVRRRVAAGTANFCLGPAMSERELVAALAAGREAVSRAREHGAQLFVAGEMGIANTTAATAMACALLNKPARMLVGPGTGLNAEGVVRKADVIQRALDHHRAAIKSPLDVLRCLGGFEIAALTGAYLACAQQGLPVLVDGFISSAAALVAARVQREASTWWFYGHASAEPGHRAVLEALAAQPLLDLGMRLGEGSGAAMAVPVLRLACALHNGMATFEAAAVSRGEDG